MNLIVEKTRKNDVSNHPYNTQAWRPSDRLCPELVGRLMTKGAAQWRANGKKELDQRVR